MPERFKNRVVIIKGESIHSDYGFHVHFDGEDKGAIVGIDSECGLVFEACMPLRGFELKAIGQKIEEKQEELFLAGLLG